MDLKITTLIENGPGKDTSLYCEHGISFYIEVDGIKILFDAGQSEKILYNAKTLKTDLTQLDYVILSHGHYDHTGGFRKLVESIGKSFKLIVGNGFFDEKYKSVDGKFIHLENQVPHTFISTEGIDLTIVNGDMHSINDHIMVVSNFHREISYEKVDSHFYKKENNRFEIDDFNDEIALIIKMKKGLFVILGCSHPGVTNILTTITKSTGMKIYGVIGGTHLLEASESRISQTINYFKKEDICFLGLSHCTGERAMIALQKEFKERFIYNNTGNIIKMINI